MAWPSIERAMVEWARANGPISALVGTRIATRLPKAPTFPFIQVQRVAGAARDGEAQIDLPLVQWDVYAAKGDAGPDWITAEDVTLVLLEETFTMTNVTMTDGYIYGMTLAAVRRIDEPDTVWARYSVDHIVMIR